MDNLSTYIESIVFANETPVSRDEVRVALENCFDTKIDKEVFNEAVEALMEKYQADHFSVEVVEIAGGLQFLTKPSYHHVVGSHLKLLSKKRLSRVAMETLAIIAYKQPVAKSEIEQIRGVNCDYAVQKLLDKELVQIEGRSDGPGRPLLYSTSPKFMDYLGLRDLNELPKLKDLETAENSIGNPEGTQPGETHLVADQTEVDSGAEASPGAMEQDQTETVEEEEIVTSEESVEIMESSEVTEQETSELVVEEVESNSSENGSTDETTS